MAISPLARRAATAAALLGLALLLSAAAPGGWQGLQARMARRLEGGSVAAQPVAPQPAVEQAAVEPVLAPVAVPQSAETAKTATESAVNAPAVVGAPQAAEATTEPAVDAPAEGTEPQAAEAAKAAPESAVEAPAEMAAAEPVEAQAVEAVAEPAAAESPAAAPARLRGGLAHAEVGVAAASSNLTSMAQALAGHAPCLCIFDIDRTLTGRQGLACPGSRVLRGVWDDACGGGDLTLSPLGARGVHSTACGGCAIGAVSHGGAGGRTMHNIILGALGSPAGGWSRPGDVHSPLVLGCGYKPPCVQGVLNWYNRRGAGISPRNVYVFDDKGSNVRTFYGSPFNARQVSCASPGGGIGLCGASPHEIRLERGVSTC